VASLSPEPSGKCKKIQQRYGLAKDMARKDVDDWLKAQDKAA
jgi:uncharacterized protein YjbJ (UPF0337 family)